MVRIFSLNLIKSFGFLCHGTVVCFASKTDIPYNQVKMKVKKLTFFMTYQVVLDLGDSKKLNLFLWDCYSPCYDLKKIGDYPKIVWKMTIFLMLYTRQWQTACLLVKVTPFFIINWDPLSFFALICSITCYGCLKLGIFLLFLAISRTSTILKLTRTDIFNCNSSHIH